jgi:GxxExxY protein
MPILPSIHLNALSDDEFATIDKIVMRCAYAVHNKFGRFFDERIYESDLAARLRAEGFDVQTQVPILVTHGNFQKTYYLDLIVNHMLYELKTASTLTCDHKAQALHYAMLQNVRLVKLINFGERQVIGKLLSNALYERERYNFILKTQNMRFFTQHCERLVDYLRKLICDWGTHLSNRLYNQALVDHFGGEAHCVHRIEIENNLRILGSHSVQLHSEDYAFVVTSLSHDHSSYHQYLNALLAHSKLKGIQWINFNRSEVEVTTLECNENTK